MLEPLRPDSLGRKEIVVALEISRLGAPVGGQVTVALAVDAPDSVSVGALQAYLRFDPGHLRLVGHVPVEQTVTFVNAQDAASGSIRLLSFRLDGLPERAAVLTFEVLEAGYATALAVEPEIAVTGEGQALDVTVLSDPTMAPDLATFGIAVAGLSTAELAAVAGYVLPTTPGEGPLLVLSSAAVVGDCDLSGSVDVLDMMTVAGIAVGLDPAPTDPNDLRVCDVDDSGALDVLDVMDVGRFAVGVSLIAAPVGFGFVPMALGYRHACALDGTGHAFCWGRNQSGQLGTGTTSGPELEPVAVTGGHTFVQLVAGESHTCGLERTGQAYCWGGEASKGTLGDGTLTDSSTPVAVAGGRSFVTLSAILDDHVCGLEASGAAYCWGEEQGEGRLGDGVSTTSQASPVAVSGGIAFKDIAAGILHTCGLDLDGQAFCWGDGFSTTPASIDIGPFTEISAGFRARSTSRIRHSAGVRTNTESWGTDRAPTVRPPRSR